MLWVDLQGTMRWLCHLSALFIDLGERNLLSCCQLFNPLLFEDVFLAASGFGKVNSGIKIEGVSRWKSRYRINRFPKVECDQAKISTLLGSSGSSLGKAKGVIFVGCEVDTFAMMRVPFTVFQAGNKSISADLLAVLQRSAMIQCPGTWKGDASEHVKHIKHKAMVWSHAGHALMILEYPGLLPVFEPTGAKTGRNFKSASCLRTISCLFLHVVGWSKRMPIRSLWHTQVDLEWFR